jgi:hypothetical protein
VGWTSIRVSSETKGLLEALRDSLQNGESAAREERLFPDTRDRIGLDQVIRVLLDERRRHNERKKRAAAKARETAKAEKVTATLWPEQRTVPAGPGSPATPVHGGGAE